MLFILLLVPISAFWPFDSSLDAETSQKIIHSTIVELGADEEEASLLTKAYLETNKQISMQFLVNEIQEQRFSGFINDWRANLFKGIVSEETFNLAKSVENPPFAYELYKALTRSFEEVNSSDGEKGEERDEKIECPDGGRSSFHI